MNNTVSSITVKKKNVYTIKIMDENGKYTGNKLEFKLDDVDLMLKLEKAAEEVFRFFHREEEKEKEKGELL